MRTAGCPTCAKRSRIVIPIAMLAVMLGFADHAFAAAGKPVTPTEPVLNSVRRVAADADGNNLPKGDDRALAPGAALAAPPANDTCGGAEALTLNQVAYGTTVGANDDYHSPKTTACFAGNGQFPTDSTGRDVVFSFTAPADGKYTFRQTARDAGSPIYGPGQNVSLYLTDCAGAGTVTCLKGANAIYGQIGVGSLGQSNQLGEAVSCFPMTTGQTTYLVFDDGTPGRCSDNAHKCSDASYCHAGATCDPQINNGGAISVEVIPCEEEVEPNDTPATASALSCGVAGASGVAPTAHCWLGDRNGNACTRPYATASYLDQSNENSNMRCLGSGEMCVLDTVGGTDDCAVGTGPCQQQTDLDCDPRCDLGPNAGKSCSTHAFCNPVSDQGATCAGACIVDLHCVVDATGVDTGIACTPTCQGSTIPSVNGRVCVSGTSFNACPGAGTCTTTAVIPALGATCSTGQTCGRQFNEGDTDFYSVGSPVAGSKVFAAVFANDANDYDYRMRVTTANNTLQFDDNDAVNFFGGTAAPVVGGAVTDGSPTYIGVSRTVPRTTNTYRVYSIVRPAVAAAQAEDESGPFGNNLTFYWPGDVIVANPSTDGYVQGAMNFPGDTDCFKILVNKGDLMDFIGDGGPGRGTGSVATISNPFPLMFDAEPAGISNFVFGTEPKKNTAANVQGAGVHALSPAVTSTYVQWRASYTGMLEVCWYDLRNFYQTSGPQTYPTNWAASMAVNCGPVQAAGPGTTTAEVSVTMTSPAGPLETGQIFDYTVTVTNEGTEIAQAVEIFDTLDPNLTFLALTVDDTLGGGNTACFSLPTNGTNDAPVDCVNASMAPGTSTVYTISVQVNNCIGSDITIANQVDLIASDSIDPDPNNNSALTSFVTVAQANNGCTDILCDTTDLFTCWADLCTNNAEVTDCDDNNLCTDDSCDTVVGCVNDSTQAGDLCDDFVECTTNACDPLLFCVFPPLPDGTSCDDGLSCTPTDHCDGQGVCSGVSVCDDGDPCTDDFADEANACACLHTPAAPGTACNDSDACTSNDVCDALGACSGGPPVVCDDGNLCNGAETCDSASGCAAGTPLSCDDGNLCNGAESCVPATGCAAGTPLSCGDGNACNGTESCAPATGCVSGTLVVCTASDQCHNAGVCSPGTGVCSNPAKPTGTACSDGDACTTADTCNAAGACVAGPARVCAPDSDACTADVCNAATGCTTSETNFDNGGFSASRVDGRDLVVLADAWASCPTVDPTRYNPAANLDQDAGSPGDCIDDTDFHLFMNSFGMSCP
jgi:uncharacterized repeat protein (TIGR01451 family)